MHFQNIIGMFNRCELFNEFESDNTDHKSLDFHISCFQISNVIISK